MACGMGQNKQYEEQSKKIQDLMKNIKHKIAVMSGKGGVGKSTVSANIAIGLSKMGYKVGLLDVDIHGPSIAGILGIRDAAIEFNEDRMVPYPYSENLKVLSMQCLLNQPDDPIIWRGPAKIGVVRQFLSDTEWGELDYLIIDTPPGTGDEPLTVAQTVDECKALLVTTPQEISLADVRKSINFCRRVKLPILGLVENMSGFVCPTCHTLHNIFQSEGGKKTAADFDIEFLGSLPIDPNVVVSGDSGQSLAEDSPVNAGLDEVLKNIINQTENK
ncbi:P-loop NTPase [Anaerosinus sp.]|uniref:P-loop NTPase n=1 Tax=Selenobaculum sp. TaxID=3074374 RepID=UPI0015B18D7D